MSFTQFLKWHVTRKCQMTDKSHKMNAVDEIISSLKSSGPITEVSMQQQQLQLQRLQREQQEQLEQLQEQEEQEEQDHRDQLQRQQVQRIKSCRSPACGPRKKIRSKISEDHRTEILSTPLPPSLAVRKRHRARVAVKTVRYCSVPSLITRYFESNFQNFLHESYR